MNYRYIILLVSICGVTLCSALPGHTQEQMTEEPVTEDNGDDLTQVRQQLQEIQQSILAKRAQLKDLRRTVGGTTDELERHELETKLEQDETDYNNLRSSFENIALGGLDLSVFNTQQQNEQFDWQQELQVILKPLFEALKQITEKPRQIERLNGQIALLQARGQIGRNALANVEKLFNESLDKSTRARLENIRKNWSQRVQDLQRELEINQLQLKVLKETDETLLQRIHQSLKYFVTGRGLNLVLAGAAFFIVYFSMKGLYTLYLRHGSRAGLRMNISTTGRHVFKFAYQVVSLFLSLAALLLVLYMLDDILLLVLALVVLLIVGLGMRNYLPRYIEETKLLLNIGAVRERERVIYKDLPWMVRSLGMYSKLFNPALDGLLRLPMSETLQLVSRPYREDEPWFPTAPGDWVMMADGTVGQVLRQTPEIVQLNTKGTVQSLATTRFLAAEPRNLSQGFGVAITFGIDYQHQNISTREVEQVLQQSIEKSLRLSELAAHVEEVLVEFQEAATSSLNYLIYITMKGPGAEHYFLLNRMVQRICVDTCNEHGWVIPFNQLTIHTGTGAHVVEEPRD